MKKPIRIRTGKAKPTGLPKKARPVRKPSLARIARGNRMALAGVR